MKRLAIMQPYLFPYLGYFQLLHAVDEYVVYDDVNFIKGGWINRNHILANGLKKRFTIALSHASPNRRILDIDIRDNFSSFLKSLDHAYHRAPCYEPARNLLDRICAFEDRNLARFTANSLVAIADYVGIDTRMIMSSRIEKDSSLRAEEKVLYICEKMEADRYINAIGGQQLYDRIRFQSRGITLSFLQPGMMAYRQFSGLFVPNLSIIDVLMFNSPQAILRLLDDHRLV